MLAIIILNWNNAEDTIKCLKSVAKQRNGGDYFVIIVDNYSTDESLIEIVEFLKMSKMSPIISDYSDFDLSENENLKCRVVKMDKNYGYAKGCNKIIKKIISFCPLIKHVLLLNNDVVLEEDTVNKCLSSFNQKAKVGFVSPQIVDVKNGHDKLISGSAVYYPLIGMGKMQNGRNRLSKNVYLSGACLFISVSVFKSVGLFDERFFLYAEEKDLQFRAKLQKWRIIINKNTKVRHYQGSSSTQSSYYYHFVKSNVLFSLKHYNLITNILMILSILSVSTIRNWSNPKIIKSCFRGVYFALIGDANENN